MFLYLQTLAVELKKARPNETEEISGWESAVIAVLTWSRISKDKDKFDFLNACDFYKDNRSSFLYARKKAYPKDNYIS